MGRNAGYVEQELPFDMNATQELINDALGHIDAFKKVAAEYSEAVSSENLNRDTYERYDITANNAYEELAEIIEKLRGHIYYAREMEEEF